MSLSDPPPQPLVLSADTPPAPDPAAPPQGVSAEQFAESQRRLEELQRKNEELERKVTAFPQERQPGGISTTIQPGISPQEAKAQLEASYLADPVGFLLQFGQLLASQVKNDVLKSQTPLTSGLVTGGIESFKRSMAADPMFSAAEAEFDRLVKEESANLNPGDLPRQLDALYSTAYGNTLRKRPPDGRLNPPPNYGIGAHAGGSPDTGQGAVNGGRKLSDEDRIYINTMREAGYDDKQIGDMMKARGNG